jgi:HSP20 family protein
MAHPRLEGGTYFHASKGCKIYKLQFYGAFFIGTFSVIRQLKPLGSLPRWAREWKRKEQKMYWTNSRARSPFEELRGLQREMNRLFEGYDNGTSLSRFPALNVWGNAEQVMVTAELPGLEIEDLDLSVANNQLTIKGDRKSEKPADDAVCHRNERSFGAFVRTVKLPFAVENDRIAAKYENGVLTVIMPRHEASKPKRIEIKTA